VGARLTGSLAGRAARGADPADDRRAAALADRIAGELRARVDEPLRLLGAETTRTGSLVVRFDGRRPCIAKAALRPTTAPRLQANLAALEALSASAWLVPPLDGVISQPIASFELEGCFCTVETLLAGRCGVAAAETPDEVRRLTAAAIELVTDLHIASRVPQVIDERTYWELVVPAVDRVAAAAARAGRLSAYERACDWLRRAIVGRELPVVYAHGNYWLGNVLVQGERRIAGVIDWDSAIPRSLPLTDALYFVIRSEALIARSSVGEATVGLLEAAPEACAGALADHARALGVPEDLRRPLTLFCWIQHVDTHCRFGTGAITNARWLQRNVATVLDALR
jgi:aminoglycoside phosphotransferase (APT) family kinase protein